MSQTKERRATLAVPSPRGITEESTGDSIEEALQALRSVVGRLQEDVARLGERFSPILRGPTDSPALPSVLFVEDPKESRVRTSILDVCRDLEAFVRGPLISYLDRVDL